MNVIITNSYSYFIDKPHENSYKLYKKSSSLPDKYLYLMASALVHFFSFKQINNQVTA
jgi:hypothetical protein